MLELELGPFLRSRREALSPADVGLPVGHRRRTPGLRRAELATLAGISVDYLVRLEQGRDRRPSGQVLAALADALRLDEEDRTYLRRVATVAHTVELCPAARPAAQAVRPTVQALLQRLEPTPAVVANHLTDLLAWTSGYESVAGALGILDGDRPNLARFTFADARARSVYPDWDTVADERVADLRSAVRPDAGEARAFADELAAAGGRDFTVRWEARPMARQRTGVTRIAHPDAGELRLVFETLDLADLDGQHLVAYLPGDDATAAALDQLTGRHPGALRALHATAS